MKKLSLLLILSLVLSLALTLGAFAEIEVKTEPHETNESTDTDSSDTEEPEQEPVTDPESEPEPEPEPEPVVLSSITVTPPAKTIYYVGDTLDTEGMSVVAVYSDGSEADVTDEASIDVTSLTAVGNTTITVTYEGQSAIFRVKVEEAPTVESLTVTPPTKTVYVSGENYDYTGMKVIATFSNGTKRDVTEDVTITTKLEGLSYLGYNDIIVTVSYGGKSSYFSMILSLCDIIDIDIINNPFLTINMNDNSWYRFKIPADKWCKYIYYYGGDGLYGNLKLRGFTSDKVKPCITLNTEPTSGLRASITKYSYDEDAEKYGYGYGYSLSNLKPDTYYYLRVADWFGDYDLNVTFEFDFTAKHDIFYNGYGFTEGVHYTTQIVKKATCENNTGRLYKICKTCGTNTGEYDYKEYISHEYGEWTTLVEPTKTKKGTMARYCTMCNKEETKSVSLVHGEYGEWKVDKEATCTERGVKSFYCRCCDKVTNTSYIPIKAHQYSSWETDVLALPERNGESSRKCIYCSKKETEEVRYSFNDLKKAEKKLHPFTDVKQGAWYNGVVGDCYHYALMLGNSSTTFNPTGNITLAEVITAAVRVWCLNNPYHGKPTLGTNPWYQGYVDFAVKQGIIKADDFDEYNRPATRAEMAYILKNSVSRNDLGIINNINEIPDVERSDKYGEEILALYRAGVLGGSDEKGTFFPDRNITRAEGAAIIARLTEISERIKK